MGIHERLNNHQFDINLNSFPAVEMKLPKKKGLKDFMRNPVFNLPIIEIKASWMNELLAQMAD